MSLFRQLVANSKTRSSGGCWTCRCRRKKCAENRPVCDTCKALDITCYFQDEKPDWMDGGRRQREMAEQIKVEVKKQAGERRDRKYLQILHAGIAMSSSSDDNDAAMRLDGPSGASDTDRSSPGRDAASTPPSSIAASASPPDAPWNSQLFVRCDDAGPSPATDLHFLIIYLDYVFPHLFPHYRPHILAGGRGWISDVVRSNKSVYHTTVSLASSFFALALAQSNRVQDECFGRMVRKLESQLELGLRELHQEMRTLIAGQSALDLKRGVVMMQGIVHMLFCEMATSNKDSWRLHLDAAIAIFFQILPTPEHLAQTLNRLCCPTWPPPELGTRRPWSTSQAALRFFTATLLYVDVLSSGTLGRPPRLCQYQPAVIPACSTAPPVTDALATGPLFLEDFFGLQNWIVQVLGDVAALECWKGLQEQAGSLSTDELLARGQVLANAIEAGLEALESGKGGDSQPVTPEWLFLARTDAGAGPDPGAGQPAFQIIWLLATLAYVRVVMLGWQPSRAEIRWPVTKATERLARTPSDSCLRALAWPLCVCGCLSPQEDEDVYRAVAQRLGPLQLFGTVKEAMDVMETVWSRRDELDERWSVYKCMNFLGYGVVLI